MAARAILFVCMLLLGRGTLAAEQDGQVQPPRIEDAGWSESASVPDTMQSLLRLALDQIGVSYHKGGINPETGFDCSGFVRYVFDQAVGVVLPHSARDISQLGKHIPLTELHPGDLVFFHTKRHIVSHVGIYIGNNQFIHDASNRTGGVRISDLTGYWARHFKLARRYDLPSEQATRNPEPESPAPQTDSDRINVNQSGNASRM
jgi:cell wall-associated NlpC family hydrolase